MNTTACDINDAIILATIVLVDNDQDRLNTTARLLEGEGYSVVTGSTAAQAASLTRLFRPELLLLEGELPDGPGADVIRKLKLDPQLAGVFVVLLTGERARPRLTGSGDPARADGYLVRPCARMEFLDRIEDFLRLREAQELLRESEARYRALFIATKNGFSLHEIICNEQGVPYDCRFIEVNAAFEELAGRPAAEIIGKSVPEAFGCSGELWKEACSGVALSGETRQFEGYFGANGRYYLVEVYVPRPGRVASMFTDVTDRKNAEQALRASEERYRAIIAAFDGSIYICSQDYRITFMNEELIRRRGPAVGEKCYKALHDLDEVCPWCVNERVFRGEMVKWEVQSPKDGRWYYIINTPIHNADGTVSKQAMIHDITHLKQAEAELKFKSFSLENLAEEIIWFSSDCRVMDVNRAACERLGYSREELLTLSANDIDPNHPREACQARWAKLKQAGTLLFESTQKTKEGRIYPVEILANYLNHDGLEYNCSIVRDITEVRQARQEILKAQKLESIGVLAGGIAHDFNNILTAILGNISLASFQVNEPEKVAKRLEEAESAAARARDLTQQLLTFARGGEPVKKVIEVGGLLREAVAFALHGSNVGCVFSLAGDLWPLEADEGQLVQVIHNLVLNAVQAMPEGGTVTVRARNDGSWQQGEGFVEISVADRGVGMSEEHLERIFDPYFTTKQQGSGLGLASCYSIIKKHQGTITVESVLGKGSTFRILLPASRQNRVAPSAAESAVSRGCSRVLVMDDEEIVRGLAKAILEQLGYQAECVENGALAAELYLKEKQAGEPFDAVILDLTVPGGVGGKEAIRMLRSIDPKVKAIVCSGYSTDPVMANYQEYGFNAVLAKPYRPHDLSRVLQELLAR